MRRGQRSGVKGQRSGVKGQGSRVRGQGSSVGGQGAGVRGGGGKGGWRGVPLLRSMTHGGGSLYDGV
jgi:hypothetical protein